MAIILNNYNLQSGNTQSSDVVEPNNVRLQIEVSGATDSGQVIELQWKVKDGANYVAMLNEKGVPILTKVKGNLKASVNYAGINSSLLRINVVVPDGAKGNLTLSTHES